MALVTLRAVVSVNTEGQKKSVRTIGRLDYKSRLAHVI